MVYFHPISSTVYFNIINLIFKELGYEFYESSELFKHYSHNTILAYVWGKIFLHLNNCFQLQINCM